MSQNNDMSDWEPVLAQGLMGYPNRKRPADPETVDVSMRLACGGPPMTVMALEDGRVLLLPQGGTSGALEGSVQGAAQKPAEEICGRLVEVD